MGLSSGTQRVAEPPASAPSTGLEFGIIIGDVPDRVTPREHLNLILRQVDTAQEQGFTYVCIGQHFLYRSFRWPQPIPLLAHLAAMTDPQVKLVISVLIVPLYHPVVLAEELATLDMVSNGRLIVGVGAGYRREEFDWFGVPFEERFARLDEAIELIQLAWSRDSFSFDGRFWSVHEASTHLRPLQQPRPPLWFGAMSKPGIRRAARLGDGWMITVETPLSEVPGLLTVFGEERAAHGLPPTRIPIRREIVLGSSSDEALDTYSARAGERFRAYAERGADFLAAEGDRLREGFGGWARERAIIGTGPECVARLRHFDAGSLGPVIVRPSWPGMSPEAVGCYLRDVGRQVIAELRA